MKWLRAVLIVPCFIAITIFTLATMICELADDEEEADKIFKVACQIHAGYMAV